MGNAGSERFAARLMARAQGAGLPQIDLSAPKGEEALVPPDSISWRVFKNPIALFIGGIAAVLLELGEPRVRSGVWDHTSFRTDPITRMKRTGMAAMITVYGARSMVEKMIARVNAMHGHVTGSTPAGVAYRADETELLDWVQVTASFGFLEAYAAFVKPLSDAERDRFYAEGANAAALYGAVSAPNSLAGQRALFAATMPKLERSEIVFEFLDIVRRAPIFPAPLRWFQRMLVRAAVEILPLEARNILGLSERFGLRNWEKRLVRITGAIAERIRIPASPPVQACERLGLPAHYLYR